MYFAAELQQYRNPYTYQEGYISVILEVFQIVSQHGFKMQLGDVCQQFLQLYIVYTYDLKIVYCYIPSLNLLIHVPVRLTTEPRLHISGFCVTHLSLTCRVFKILRIEIRFNCSWISFSCMTFGFYLDMILHFWIFVRSAFPTYKRKRKYNF